MFISATVEMLVAIMLLKTSITGVSLNKSKFLPVAEGVYYRVRNIAMGVACLLALGVTGARAGSGGKSMDISFESGYARWVISPDGKLVSFEDKQAKKNYAVQPAAPIAHITKAGKNYDATSVLRQAQDAPLVVTFGDSGVTATIGVTQNRSHVSLLVLSVSDEKIDSLTFVDFPTTLTGDMKHPFAVCALALNLQTNVPDIPGPNTRLTAVCYPKFGLTGSQVALIACPTAKLRDIMKEVVSAAPDLPHSPRGGPWALDQPCNRESYFFNFGDLTEKNVDQWIALAKNLGIPEIDFHGGGSFRFGDCRPNPGMYPNGRASFKAVIDKLHAAGIKAGLHTYAHFINQETAWVTPVPSPDLAKDATFTLASAIDENTDKIVVNESTKDMSTVMGFATRNSITIQIDDELIRFHNISKEPPYAFYTVNRGLWGTKITPHASGAKVYHLKECFGLFCPAGNSKLMVDVAAATADFYNECGFDMIYLDALDGEDVMGDPGEGWYYGSKFVFEIFKRLKKAPIMEMSTFHHHLWYVRSRMGAWDHPVRSYKQFIDLHSQSNTGCDHMFLPAHLGWWRTITGLDFQKETTFPDDLEYALAKCAAHQCGISPQEFTPESYASSGYLRRMARIYKTWEELRLAGFFNEKMRSTLAEPDQDFTLATDTKGKPSLKHVDYAKQKVEGLGHPSANWTVTNRYESQPLKLRIEGLLSAGSYDSPEAVTVVDFTDPALFTVREQSAQVVADIGSSKEQVKAGSVSGLFTASAPPAKEGDPVRTVKFSTLEHAQRVVKGSPSYCKLGVKFDPNKDLTDKTALGVWVYGDGQGEVLNIQMLSPIQTMSGYCDRYIPIDFTGWRYFELIESEGERAETFLWPYSGSAYAMFRETITPSSIESLNVWYNLIPAGGTAKCYLSPIKALPMVTSKVVNPAITVNGKKLIFPTELPSGSWIEYNSPIDCKLYDSNGNFVADVKPQGDPPALVQGENDVTFTCDPPSGGLSARARVVVISDGPGL